MTWYVEASAAAETLGARPAAVREGARRYAATVGEPTPSGRRANGEPAIQRVVRIDEQTWGTVNIDVTAVASQPEQSRAVVFGCFWGGLDNPAMTAPPAPQRIACQELVDGIAAALSTHLRATRAGLSGTAL